MGKNEKTVEEMIQAAVKKATDGILAGVDLKIQKALELGIEIGAAKGAEIGAMAAIQAVESERKKLRQSRFDRQLRNTRLLLQHYRSLNKHYTHAVWEEESDGDSFIDFMELMNRNSYNDDVFVESIKKSAQKTKIIMRHVNAMLEQYRQLCESSTRPEDARHWRVVKALYIEPVRVPAMTVAEQEQIDKRTVYKDVDAAVADITMLLFGIDGIEKL